MADLYHIKCGKRINFANPPIITTSKVIVCDTDFWILHWFNQDSNSESTKLILGVFCMEQQEIQSDTSEIKTSIKQTAIIAHWDDGFVLGTCKIN